MRVFITGIAGFIAFHVALKLIEEGVEVFGIDNFNSYYDVGLKRARARKLQTRGIKIEELDLNASSFRSTLLRFKPTHVLHLAAQAGVRYSLSNPEAYVQANIKGFLEVLEAIKQEPSISLVYASSSSVYGLNDKLPYSVQDKTDQQASFYGVTKKANELMAANYTHLYGFQAVGLRYFTVYGPWGRPDMALFAFTKAILEDRSIDLYNFGKMERDFTYIDDIVEGTLGALRYRGKIPLFNLGSHAPVSLSHFVDILEETLGKKAKRNLLPFQKGDVITTYADIQESEAELGFRPKTSLQEGITHFTKWYLEEYAKGGT